jgi:hypothetical protein
LSGPITLSFIESVIAGTSIAIKGGYMVAIHPNILERDGQKAFVILPYEEFLMMEEELEQYEDLKQLREAKVKESDSPTMSLNAVKKELGL